MRLWSEGLFEPGRTVNESLTEAAKRSDLAVFVLTADDTRDSRAIAKSSLGANLLFELGFLSGLLGLSRVFVVLPNDSRNLDLPSDLSGIVYFRLNSNQAFDLPTMVAPVAAAITKLLAEIVPRTTPSPEFPSCFISYSWNDKEFANRLCEDLEQVGVQCWLDAKELTVGASISGTIRKAIQAHDRVVVVLSQASVRSSWVRQEIKNASRLEQARKTPVLFPISLDQSLFLPSGKPHLAYLRDRLVLDFSGWRDQAKYQKAFSSLVRDLSVSASLEAERKR